MNLTSLKQELAQIIIDYAAFQKNKSTFRGLQSSLEISAKQLGTLSIDKEFRLLETAVNTINSRYGERAAHLKLILAFIKKMHATEEYIADLETSHQDAKKAFAKMHSDVKRLLTAYELLLSDYKDIAFQFNTFEEDQATPKKNQKNQKKPSVFLLNPLRHSSTLIKYEPIRLKQLGTYVKRQLTTLDKSFKSSVNSLDLIEKDKQIKLLEQEKEALESRQEASEAQYTEAREKSKLSSASEQAKQEALEQEKNSRIKALEQLVKKLSAENASLKEKNAKLKDLSSVHTSGVKNAIDVIEKHGIEAVRKHYGLSARKTRASKSKKEKFTAGHSFFDGLAGDSSITPDPDGASNRIL